MLRGLLVRQLFLLLDLVLAGLVVAVAALLLAGSGLLGKPGAGLVEATPVTVAHNTKAMLHKLEPRESYNTILKNGLFGAAGRWDPNNALLEPVAPPVSEDVLDTKLNLRLAGTIALTAPQFRSAFVQNLDDTRSGSKGYLIGENVVSNVTLEEIFPRHVVLLNMRHSPARRERLSMDEEDPTKLAKNLAPQPPVRATRTQRITLNKAEVIQELNTSYADLVTKVRPEMRRDAAGKIVGVTAGNISQIPLAKKLGLQDGDVLASVNNEKIDSEAKIFEVVQKYQNASSIRIGVVRNGKAQVITYSLK